MPATIAHSVTPVDDVTGNGANRSRGSGRSVEVNPTIRAAAAVSAALLTAGCATTATARRPASNATVAPSPTPSYDTAGLSVLAGNTVLTRTGDRVDLALPAGITAFDATEVPAGWVVEADETTQHGVWFAGTTGQARRLGQLWGSYAVSPDGTVLVVAGLNAGPAAGSGPTSDSPAGGGDTVVAYSLPDLRELGRTSFQANMGPMVVGVTADRRALLRGAQGSPGPSDTAVLDLRTNTLHRAAEAWAWDLSGDGRALRRVDPLGRDANGKPLPGISCLDVVALTDTL